jgi:DNA-binding CsgD family transcriptional regulator
LSLLQADPATARPWIARAVVAARGTGPPALLSEALSIAATVENMAGEHEVARRYLDEAEAITAGLDDFPATIELVQSRAIHAIFEGDLELVRAASLEGVRLSREAGDLYQLEAMLRNLGMVGMMSGDLHTASSQFREALQVARHVDNRMGQSYGLGAAGWYAANTGQARAAAQLLGAAEAAGRQTGADIMGPFVPVLAQAKESARGALGSAKFEAEFQAGRRLSRVAALHLALGESDQAELAASDDAESAALGKRELEVARLVADGLSNKQIATRLFISDRTVATHVGNILNKLGFNSRAQVATWVASSNR